MEGRRPADVSYAAGTDDDVAEVAAVYGEGIGRHADESRIRRNMRLYPSFVARNSAGVLVGFAFSVDFAPDILELANIFVVPDFQSSGVGTALITRVEEAAADAGFRQIILVNSMLAPATYSKRPATRFYMDRGYDVILDTGPSKVFAKKL